MSSWKYCTQSIFNDEDYYNHGEYLIENGVIHFNGTLLPPLDRLSPTLATSAFTNSHPTLSSMY